MKVGVGYSDNPNSAAAGKQVAEIATQQAGRQESCDLALLFCTARHNQKILREAVSVVIGKAVPIYGGGAIGIITNDSYGYAGDQVGIACLWLDGARFDAVIDNGLVEGEENTGFRLGQGIAKLGITHESSTVLLYDAIHRDDSGLRMMMATWILAGLEKALGFLPTMVGAGLFADFELNPTNQFIGQSMSKHNAMALVFGAGIHIDSVIMHGCRPASQYYTVTKAEGPVILEINNRPALTFLDELLASAIKPEQYPFFLIFGVNDGERWDEYNEANYASRLCLGIDPERGGIVMFEPDMIEGTEFQLMFRSLELDYMKPKIESLFNQLDGRKPVFALYIDCAGRCAGYGGSELEDALVLQQAIAGRVPILGIYSGVEIAPVAGRPRGLDWTGVLCLFSIGEKNLLADNVNAKAEKAASKQPKSDSKTQMEAVLKMCEQNAAKVLSLDTQFMMLRYELELKRRGFRLISELIVSLRQTDNYEYVFTQVSQRLNASLNMQKTLVLLSDGAGMFMPKVLQGFSMEEQEYLTGCTIKIPDEILESASTLVTAVDSVEHFAEMRAQFNLPFFIALPIVIMGETVALLLTGRMVEQPPYLSRLGHGDVETVQAISELMGSVLLRLHLRGVIIKSEADNLTGLLNRNTFQRKVEDYLNWKEDKAAAFLMVDLDYFKNINDTYGHIVGDTVLKECAEAMQKVLRESDIIGRQGGDEFVVFCQGIRDSQMAEKKASQIMEAWKEIIPEHSTKHVTASIGISIAPQHGTTFNELYNNADTAMYRAKKQGRGCFVLFS